MREQETCPVYSISKTRWDNCPIEEKLKARIKKMEEALNEILECEVITDCGDYSSGETGYECEEVKKIVREALKGEES